MDESDGASLPKRGRPFVYGGKTTRIRLDTVTLTFFISGTTDLIVDWI